MHKPMPIAFKTKNEFQERPNYQANLSCKADELDYIVGKYHFSKEDAFQCGLNHCNQWHQIGFVIATKDGTETHCGQKCGANAFGVTWEEVEAVFKKQEEAMNRRASLQRIHDESNSILKRCADLYTKSEPLVIRVQKIIQEISTEQTFKNELDKTIKLGGQIFGKAPQSEFMSEGNKTILIATINGGGAMSLSTNILRILKFQIQQPLKDLIEKNVQTLSDNEIKEHLSAIRNYESILNDAEQFIGQARSFLEVKNLQKIELLIEQLPKHARNQRVRRIATKICTLN